MSLRVVWIRMDPEIHSDREDFCSVHERILQSESPIGSFELVTNGERGVSIY